MMSCMTSPWNDWNTSSPTRSRQMLPFGNSMHQVLMHWIPEGEGLRGFHSNFIPCKSLYWLCGPLATPFLVVFCFVSAYARPSTTGAQIGQRARCAGFGINNWWVRQFTWLRLKRPRHSLQRIWNKWTLMTRLVGKINLRINIGCLWKYCNNFQTF